MCQWESRAHSALPFSLSFVIHHSWKCVPVCPTFCHCRERTLVLPGGIFLSLPPEKGWLCLGTGGREEGPMETGIIVTFRGKCGFSALLPPAPPRDLGTGK